jgi:peptidyl-prolyl cis-trans isomerase C
MVFGLSLLLGTASLAQEKPTAAAGASAEPAAATVNGFPIPEKAVQRALRRVPPERQAESRPDIVNFLIDNAVIDQYLIRTQKPIAREDVDAKVKEVVDEIKKQGSSFEKVMKDLMVTETELREQITAQLRWDRFALEQGNEKALHGFFDQNPDMFDGTMVRARHILLTPPSADAKANADAKARLVAWKKQLEDNVAQGLAKLPADTENLQRERMRAKLLEEAFSEMAKKESACPSKVNGGDLEWFPRAGSMVEPFAKAAFALKPYQMSDVVTTQYGHHLILVTDRRPGKATRFEDIKDQVLEIYCQRLREAMAAKLRATAEIVIQPMPK